LAKEIEKTVIKEDILSFLKKNVKEDLKFHHEFRISLSDCPNACSRPQIVDIGIIGSVMPGLSDEPCTLCNSCVEACAENAICLDEKNIRPVIDYKKCLMCAKCIKVCPSSTIKKKTEGFRIMLGGRLGRRPRLAMEVPGIHNHKQIIEIVKKCLKFYKTNSLNGQRFSHLLNSIDQIIKL
ncbi:4Fe-4S dicluster domain-containing protein, partial [bacterium]|nr:4Fe-4S dicluster domain-containing protein [bacterium]